MNKPFHLPAAGKSQGKSLRFFRTVSALFLISLMVPLAQAQDTVTGAFEGNVTNSLTGDPVEGATAEITNVETGVAFTKRSDARGRFYQGLLPPGVYRIKVSMPNFQTREIEQRLKIAFTGEVVPVPVSLDPIAPGTSPPPVPVTTPPATPPTGPPATTPIPPPATSPIISPATAADTEVRASINTLDARRSGSFSETDVASLPLGGITFTRSFDELALLLPGVAPPPQTLGSVAGPGQGAGVGTSGQFAVNGLRSRANNFTVDGSDNNDEDIGVRRQGFVALIPQPIESIKEYQAITLLAPAQFGRNLGAQVNAVSKSGGNRIHGALYGFFNSSRLNARNPFDTTFGNAGRELRAGNDQAVVFQDFDAQGRLLRRTPVTTTNQSGGEESFSFGKAGGAISGPIRKNSTFYFGSFEWQKINARQEESFAVPTVEQRGAFGTGATGLFRDPFNGLGRNQLPSTVNAGLIFSLFPFANNPQGIYGPNTFTQNLAAGARGVVASFKLDHNFKLAEREQSFTARYNFTDDWREIPATGEAIFSALRPEVRTQNLSLFFNGRLSAPNAADQLFNQVRFSYGRTRLRFEEVRDTQFLLPSNFADTPFLLNAPFLINATLPNAPNQANTRDVVFQRIAPELVRTVPTGRTEIGGPLGQAYIAGFSPVGVDVYNFPQRRVNNTYQLADNLTWRHNDHGFTFGTDIRRTELNSDLPRVARPLVTYNGGPRLIQEGATLRPANANEPVPFLRPQDLAALDAPNAFFLTVNTARNDAAIGLRFYQLNLFAQDEWRVRRDLLLSYGLRYEYNSPPREVNNLIERTFSDPALNQVPGLRSFINGRSRIFDPDRDNFAPRVSLAYSPTLFGKGRTSVFRGGYGLFYDQILGAVVSQSRNVFPTFLTLNFCCFNAQNRNVLTFVNPAQTVLQAGAPLVEPGTTNRLNPRYDLTQLLNFFVNGTPGTAPFPDALGLTLPERKLDTPLAHHYTFSFEQQLSGNLTASAAYVGTLGRNLLRFTTPNQGPGATIVPVNAGTTGSPLIGAGAQPALSGRVVNPARSVGGVGAVNLFATTAASRYDSLQLELRGRLRRATQFQLAYTLSRAEDDVSDVFDLAGAYGLPQNSRSFAGERGPANFDARHRFTSTFFSDFSALGEQVKALDWLFDNLQLAGIARASSGQPFTVNSIYDINLDGNLTDRLNSTAGLIVTDEGSRPVQLGTTNTFSLLAPVGQDGSVGRNSFRAGGRFEIDLALMKGIRFRDQRLTLRAEIFNLFNRANFGVPVRLLEAPGFGAPTRTLTPARRIQFVLRYEF